MKAFLPTWALVVLSVVAVTVLYCDISRFRYPEAERYLFPFKGGQYDFSQPYLGARALLDGVNPWVNDRPEFTHPFFTPIVVEGIAYKLPYPPGSLTTLVPLAAIYGDDWREAGRLWFLISFASLIATAWVAWQLVRDVTGTAVPWTLALVFLFCLTLAPAGAFALERGQAEIFTAALCWGAVVLCLRGRFGPAMFLAAWAASIKGYAILFAIGLGVIAFDQRVWRTTFAGGAAAAICFVLPCAAWLGDAWRAALARASEFEPAWFNHSFRHIAFRLLGPVYADWGKGVAVAIALSATLLALIQAVRAYRSGTNEARALWLTAFSVPALGVVVGLSDQSVSYNFVLLTPGLLVLGATLHRWAAPFLGHPVRFAVVGVMTVVTWWLCFVNRLGVPVDVRVADNGAGFPATGLGLVLFNLLALLLAAAALRRPMTTTAGV